MQMPELGMDIFFKTSEWPMIHSPRNTPLPLIPPIDESLPLTGLSVRSTRLRLLPLRSFAGRGAFSLARGLTSQYVDGSIDAGFSVPVEKSSDVLQLGLVIPKGLVMLTEEDEGEGLFKSNSQSFCDSSLFPPVDSSHLDATTI